MEGDDDVKRAGSVLHDVLNPQDSNEKTVLTANPPQLRKLHDKNVSFKEYLHYAAITRAEQDELPKSKAGRNVLAMIVPNLAKTEKSDVKAPEVNIADQHKRMHISDEEWTNASRALRTATAGAVFYLITTDILGPFGLPYAFASTGWGPGVALYTVFGFMAGVSGYLLWDCFMGIDSFHYPVKAYGDLAFRIYGQWFRYLVNVLQAIQLLSNVAVIIISNGQALSEVAKFKLCYAICCLVWALAGMVLGQIRTLQKFGWLANVAVFINLIIMFVTMGAAANSPPLYSASGSAAGYAINPVLVTPVKGVYPPVQHSAGLPDPGNFGSAVNGLMQAVYAYGGAMIFPEFMSEMRRPRDFLKGMWGAQLFIYICYMFYGCFIYGYQGQYVTNPTYLGIAGYGLQTTGNVLAIITALIAAALYGNIGIKVIYSNILMEFFHAPPLNIRSGKLLWVGIVPIYWAIAFALGAAIPDFSGLTGVIAATCILHFCYTFPPWLYLGYRVQVNAARTEQPFDPVTGETHRTDSGIKRIIRGFFGPGWYINVATLIYALGSMATGGLGAWASIEALIAAFKNPQFNAYSCHSPLDVSA